MPGTALLTWERGYQPDQATRLPALARHLADQGWRVVLAVKDVTGFATADPPWTVMQSPVWPTDQRVTIWSVAQAPGLGGWLRALQYDNPAMLRPILRAWAALYDLVKPDLVIADDGPGAVLAARGRVPCLTIGSAIKVMPETPDSDADAALTARINTTLSAEGLPLLDNLTQSQRGDASLVFSFPLFDSHAGTRQDTLCRPVEAFADPVPGQAGHGLLLHLGIPAAQNDALMASVMQSPGERHLYAPFLPAQVSEAMSAHGISLVPDLAAADALISRAALVVHSGGPSRVQRLAAAGVPQLLIHGDAELAALAEIITAQGVGQGLALGRLLLPEVLDKLGDEQALERQGAAARALSSSLRAFEQPDWPQALDAAISRTTA